MAKRLSNCCQNKSNMANHKTNSNGVPQWAIKWFKRYDMWFEKLNQITLEIERRNQKQDELIEEGKKRIEQNEQEIAELKKMNSVFGKAVLIRIEHSEKEVAELKKMNDTYGKAILKLLSKQK